MARLKLMDGKSYLMVGQVIADLATSKKRGQLADQQTQIDEFVGMIDEKCEVFIGANSVAVSPGSGNDPQDASVEVHLHFDRTEKRGDQSVRIVNVVVPDFEDKLAQIKREGTLNALIAADSDLEKAVADLDAVAKEAFGFITICGCAG